MRRTTRGFTLIELLIVIAIMGILASVIITALGDSRKKADDANFKIKSHSIKTAMELYVLDNSTYPPCPGQVDNSFCSTQTAFPPALGGYDSNLTQADYYSSSYASGILIYSRGNSNAYAFLVVLSTGACKTGVNPQQVTNATLSLFPLCSF